MSNRANIQAVIAHMEKVGRHSRYTYNADKCSVRKGDFQKTIGCALHHVMWTFEDVDEPLLTLRNDLRKFAAKALFAGNMFESSEFMQYLNDNFWDGAGKYFRQPSTDFTDMLNYLRNRANLSPAPSPESVPTLATPNDTVTITRGSITMQVPANDPKVKELLAYLAEKLV